MSFSEVTSKILERAISGGLMALLAFTALAHGAVEPWSLLIFGALTVTLLVLWLVKGAVDRRLTLRIPAVTWPLLALLGLGLAQSVAITGANGRRLSLSLDVEATRLTTLTLFCLIIALLLFAGFLVTQKRLQGVINAVICFGFLLAIFGLVQSFTWNGCFYWVREPSVAPSSPFGPFVNHNHFAGYLEMIAPMAAAMALLSRARAETRILYGFAALMMSVAVIASLSRGGMISLTASLILVFVLGWRPGAARAAKFPHSSRPAGWPLSPALSRLSAVTLMAAAIAVGILWIGPGPLIKRVAQSRITGEPRAGQDSFFKSRGFIWSAAAAMFRANPISGVGLGAFQTAYPAYSRHDVAALPVAAAHNDYLQIVTDGGILGGAAALWFLALILRAAARGARSADQRWPALALGCGGGVFALLVHSLFDFNLQLPSNALLFLLLSAAVCHLGAGAARAERKSPTFPRLVYPRSES